MSGMEIDWGAASFESGEDERARREREAMESLSRRIAERDVGGRELPTMGAVFPDDIAPPAPNAPAPLEQQPTGMLTPPLPGDLGPVSPPSPVSPSDPGPPALSTSPQPPEPTAEASTNPEAQTATAGSAAASLRRDAPPRPEPGSVDELMAQERERMEAETAGIERRKRIGTAMINAGGPTDAPTAALGGPTGLASDRTRPLAPMGGETGLDGGQSLGMARSAMEAERQEPTFDERREQAREEDARRRRIRAILMGLAGIAGLATARGGGGGALLGAIPAAMVRRPDEEETLLEEDARAREMGAEEAEQASVVDRLRLQREQAERQEAERLRRFGLDTRRAESQIADRAQRTGIELRENEREEELLLPESAVSGRERASLRSTLANQPGGVRAAYPDEMLNGLSATELRSIRNDLERGGRARVIARGRGTEGGAYSGSASTGGLAGAGIAPAWYVTMVAEGNGRAPGQETATDRTVADESWGQFSEERRAQLEASGSSAGAETIAVTEMMRNAGYEQAVGGHIPDAMRTKALQAHTTRAVIVRQVSRALRALDEFGEQGWWTRARGVGADFFGANENEAIAAYNSSRGGIMSALAAARGAGVIGEAEYARFVREMPDVSSVAGLVGAARSMRQIATEINTNADAIIESNGYRLMEGAGRMGVYSPSATGRDDSAPSPRQAPSSRGTRLRFRDRDGNVHRTRRVTDEAAARRVIENAGGTVL